MFQYEKSSAQPQPKKEYSLDDLNKPDKMRRLPVITTFRIPRLVTLDQLENILRECGVRCLPQRR